MLHLMLIIAVKPGHTAALSDEDVPDYLRQSYNTYQQAGFIGFASVQWCFELAQGIDGYLLSRACHIRVGTRLCCATCDHGSKLVTLCMDLEYILH